MEHEHDTRAGAQASRQQAGRPGLQDGAASPATDGDSMLAGLTVLDLSQGIAGPYCGLLLSQQGARVIKVEPPAGDWGRQMGRARGGQTAISIAYNAGKESVVLDATTTAGREAMRRLAGQADVVIQNFRPGVAERLGLGYAALAEARPELVYASISGYGPSGPLSALPAVDTTMQAFSGLMHVNRDADGRPRRIGFFVVDLCTGLYAAQSVCAALFRSLRNGRGRHLEVSMLETSAALQSYLVLDDAMFPEAAASAFNAPTGMFETADGLLYLSMLNDAMFRRLAQALGLDEWLADPGLATSAGRMPRAAELGRRVAAVLATRPLSHWESVLQAHDILHARVRQPHELLASEQGRHLGLFASIAQAGIGALPWARTPGYAGRPRPAPLLGEHTDAVLAEFGIADGT